ncbi:MAG: HisA/HisF-related TIM barrel protein [Actinomycetota bacterium]|nr:HisA/HisF-related TIM barrel protein [Actinomycetota bacterium]
MELYPSIDLLDGDVVRLRKGDYGDRIDYGADAVATASGFADGGATWIHVVDLDAARCGTPVNRGLISDIAAAVAGRARVQTGGGVRMMQDVETLAAAGLARVVMGSAAVAEPALVSQAAGVMPVAVGLDHRDGQLAVHGWTEGSGVSLLDAVTLFPDAAAFVVTNIATDGMMDGPDVTGLAMVADVSPVPVIASGGVGSLDDLRALVRLGTLAGVITGRALYEGRFGVEQALAVIGGHS